MKKLRHIHGEEIYDSKLMRTCYATDASIYKEMPMAVVKLKSEASLQKLVKLAFEEKFGLIPRGAGTSLAGQVVGAGVVIDFSCYQNKLLEFSKEEAFAWAEPGIIRNDLNRLLADEGVFFAPETATASRACIAGMIGNNSCGANSLIYGSTREHVLALEGFLSDGSKVTFAEQSPFEYAAKVRLGKKAGATLEHKIYAKLHQLLGNKKHQRSIEENFPAPSIKRRNHGYAIDSLLEMQPFKKDGRPFNLCSLLAGSEGTLFFISKAKLRLMPLPEKAMALVAAHFKSVDEALRANILALKHAPSASELIDSHILECTKLNILQKENRSFVEGDPGAILIVEKRSKSLAETKNKIERIIEDFQSAGLGYAYPVLVGEQASKVWELRRSGLGILSNMPGDSKPIALIEDTAVTPEDLPAYIAELNEGLALLGLSCVHYAHAGAGELHLRPILNLKEAGGVRLMKKVASEAAALVKKYGGSLSGEHGDGRLRGSFIEFMYGKEVYELLKEVKKIFDVHNIFNPNKIIDVPPLDTQLRYTPGESLEQPKTYLDFSAYKGMLRLAEMCNGSGECRRSHGSGGQTQAQALMCPSFMLTLDEAHTTRARANVLREMLKKPGAMQEMGKKGEGSDMILAALDLCVSCKGCKSECPSSVDMASMKVEYLAAYIDKNGASLRQFAFAYLPNFAQALSKLPGFFSLALQSILAGLIKKILGIAPERSLPKVAPVPFHAWLKKQNRGASKKSVRSFKPLHGAVAPVLFIDEFSNFFDIGNAKACYQLFTNLGLSFSIAPIKDSARSLISKGFLKQAAKLSEKNVLALKDVITQKRPLVGIEPSAILGFRDEGIGLLRGALQAEAKKISEHVFTLEEFIALGLRHGFISRDKFKKYAKRVLVHIHCHQKTLTRKESTVAALSLISEQSVKVLATSCCGMAGSFGYEKEHYRASMGMAELRLFPAFDLLRKKEQEQEQEQELMVATGFSCREQLWHGRKAKVLSTAEALLQGVLV